MNAEIEEIASKLYNVSIGGNENETGYASASSDSERSDSFDDDDEEDDASEASEGAASRMKSLEERSPSRNEIIADISDPKDAPAQDDVEDDDEEDNATSSSSEATLTGNELEEEESEPHSSFISDRGAGDADRLLDSNMFVVAEDSSDHGEIRTQILARRRQHDPEAYQKWILAKNEEIRRNREQEKLQKQQLEEQNRNEAEQRKEISRLKVQQWMERKKRSERVGTNPHTTPQSYEQKFLQKDAEVKYNAWLERIKQQDKEKMQKKMLEKQMAQKAREEKMKISQEVYQKWLKSSRNKPLPVPLNQGPNTLRGTVSKIFVNPVPWKSNFE